MTRADALAAATTFVDGIAPRTNSRGYSDGCLTPGQRIAEVLRVADWLLSGEDDEPAPSALAAEADLATAGLTARPKFNHPNTGGPL